MILRGWIQNYVILQYQDIDSNKNHIKILCTTTIIYHIMKLRGWSQYYITLQQKDFDNILMSHWDYGSPSFPMVDYGR